MRKENETISNIFLLIKKYKGNYHSFRHDVLSNDYSPKSKHFSRLLIWKTCLITETLNIQVWKEKLGISRAIYHKLRKSTEMCVPWWQLEPDNEFYLDSPTKNRNIKQYQPQKLARIRNITNDPLATSAEEERGNGVSDIVDSDIDTLNSIILDIQRLFPGDELFHDKNDSSLRHKRQLVTILYVWSKSNGQVGYKQGIHEIIGLIYKNMHAESLQISNTNTYSPDDLCILSLYDLNYLEHDVFFIFNRFVVNSGIIGSFYQSEASLMASIETFNGFLMKVDQLIHYNLITKLRIDSQIWIIRFLRLILLRELGNDLEVASLYWDKLATAEASGSHGSHCITEIIMFSIIVLLINLKSELALCDFTEALSLLLHYPISTRLHLYPNFIDSLFKDAYYLYGVKDKDLKLYEYGIKLNKKYSSLIKVNLGYASGGENSSNAASSNASPKSSVELPGPKEARKLNMAFEKSRLEMRLKHKAQQMIRK